MQAQDLKLFGAALGLTAPWQVTGVAFDARFDTSERMLIAGAITDIRPTARGERFLGQYGHPSQARRRRDASSPSTTTA